LQLLGCGKNPSARQVKAGPDLGVVGGSGVVSDCDVPELEMDLRESGLLDGSLGLLILELELDPESESARLASS